MFPSDLKYLQSHEWAKNEGDIIVVGISDYAQGEIQDVVYVELPEVGQTLEQGKEFGAIESVKAAFDLYAPASGDVVEIIQSLEDSPELINAAPYQAGWLIKIQLSNPDELGNLLSADEYQRKLEADREG